MKQWLAIKQNASISLTVVIVVMAILLSTGITILLVNIDLGVVAKDYLNYQLNIEKSQTCTEEALNRLNANTTYLGTFNVSFTDGTCSGTVTLQAGNANLRNLALTATTGTYTFAITKQIDISTNPYKLINQ